MDSILIAMELINLKTMRSAEFVQCRKIISVSTADQCEPTRLVKSLSFTNRSTTCVVTMILLIGLITFVIDKSVAADYNPEIASNACKKSIKKDKQLANLESQTVCYQAAIGGDRFARKMLHRSAYFASQALRLYLDVAIPLAKPGLGSDLTQSKRLRRLQTGFWHKQNHADHDLMFLHDNAGLPYRIADSSQKEKIAEVIVHFQKGLNTNIESTPGGAPLAGRYILKRPVNTWLIDGFEPIRLKASNPMDWLTDYIHYTRSARGNPISLEFIQLADESGLPHFWVDGGFDRDAEFMNRNQGKGFFVTSDNFDSTTSSNSEHHSFKVGFAKKETSETNSASIVDPQNQAQYQIVKKYDQWFIASFKELASNDHSHTSSSVDDNQLVFENATSLEKYLSESQVLIKQLKNCEPSEFIVSVPTVPAKNYRYDIQGYEDDLCHFIVKVIGAISISCKAPPIAINTLVQSGNDSIEQLEKHTNSAFPITISLNQNLKAKASQVMNKVCELTIDKQPPIDMDKYVDDTFTYIQNLGTCNPSTYSYPHPFVPGFIGKNVIRGNSDGNCLIDMYMPNDMIMKCTASNRTVELMQYQTRVMLKELQDSGRYEFSIEINVGTGSTSELSKLIGEECKW